jgi:7,8-dihydropterin-6-yl-methyl-4-(beta-D-ribofuranosyl)aminobenzene 5'-phosphate synthase
MNVRILYDNRALEGYRADWGFSCLIEGEENILFDTGARPDVLAHNMQQARLSPAIVDKIVLSHDHWDHTGGLSCVTDAAGSVPVYVLPSFAAQMRATLGEAAVIREVPEACELAGGLHSTGPVGRGIREQAVWFDTPEGLLMATGCAHPGVDALLYSIRPRKPVYGVLGGFHGFRKFDALAGIPFLAPCHCTEFRSEIASRFPDSFADVAAGTYLEF